MELLDKLSDYANPPALAAFITAAIFVLKTYLERQTVYRLSGVLTLLVVFFLVLILVSAAILGKVGAFADYRSLFEILMAYLGTFVSAVGLHSASETVMKGAVKEPPYIAPGNGGELS